MTAENRIGGFFVIHYRATDVCYFGPFRTAKEALDWSRDRASDGLRGVVVPMVHPNVDSATMWEDAYWEPEEVK